MEIYIKQENDEHFTEKEDLCNTWQQELCSEPQKVLSINLINSEGNHLTKEEPAPFEVKFFKKEIETSNDSDNVSAPELCGPLSETKDDDNLRTTTIIKKESEEEIKDCSKEADKISDVETDVSYTCSICKYQSDSRDDYVKHMNSVHGMVRPAVDKRFMCNECNRQFTRSSSLKRHMQFHTGVWPMNCSVCNKGFNSLCNLSIHIRIHTGERPFTCKECSEGFTHLPSYKRHMRVHAGETPYKCTVCNRGFTDSGVLKVHMRTHTGEKPFVCSVCNKTFTVASSLNKHMQIHLDDKPYKCTVCNRGFTQAVSFRRHLKLHT